ncbi:MAG TPA: sulfatase, partial [Planctomycetota bacterium]|nr:sulfatase [Planctomycetota bacterium]
MAAPDRSFRDALWACAVAGACAAGFELIRALTAPTALSSAYAAWCVLLIIGASLAAGAVGGLLLRVSPTLGFAPWLAGAGALAHGWVGAVVFLVAGAAAGAWARKFDSPLLPLAAATGLLFKATGKHANRIPGDLDPELASTIQHVLGYSVSIAVLVALLAWLLPHVRARFATAGATLSLVLVCAAFAARDAGLVEDESPARPRGDRTAAEDGPSVLLLVLDTVRADHTSVDGYARKTTPELERLLATRPGARRFTSAYANGSWTVPAHASLLSGQLPSVHGADFAGLETGEPMGVAIAPEVPMLAEGLARAGWKTFAVFANRWLKNAQGFRRGFQDFERVEPRPEMDPLGETLRLLLVPGLRAGEMASFPTAEFVAEKLLARIDALGNARFFGLVNFMDAHGPHAPLPDVAGTYGPWSIFDESPKVHASNSRELNQRLMDRYDEQILHLDRELGRLFEALERRGILDRTWVIVTADHGEAFGEHGVTDHGSGVFDEIVRVPLLVFPPRGATLEASSAAVAQVDVAATIAAIADVEYHGPGRDLRVPASL